MSVTVLEEATAGRIRLATAVRSGAYVFVGHGSRPQTALPHSAWETAPAEREAAALLGDLTASLARAGATPADVVRLDQYYAAWQTVPHYHAARRRVFAGAIPTSTSILEEELVRPGGRIELLALARVREPGESYRFITPDGLEVSPEMGFSPIVETPEFAFFAGQMAEDGNGGIAAAAKVPATHLWKGSAIALQTRYLIANKLRPALDAAGLAPCDVVKAQVYLASIEDAGAFNAIWRDWFDGAPPATTVVPTSRPGFNCPDAVLEVNLLAARAGTARARVAPAGGPPLYSAYPGAVRTGGLLFLSGLMALDDEGLAADARFVPEAARFASPAEAETEAIIARTDAIAAAAGARLDDVVRIVHFHTDLADVYLAARAWQRRLGGRPIPFTAVRVPAPLALPGARVLADIVIGAADGENAP